MRFKVTKQYGRGPETPFAQFADLSDAKFFVNGKLEDDKSLNVKVTYRIFEFTELVTEYDPSKPGVVSQSSSGASSQGKSGEARFNPTPLSTTPRPTGMPQNWRVDKDEDEKKK